MSKHDRKKEKRLKMLLELEKNKPKEHMEEHKHSAESRGMKKFYEKHYKSLVVFTVLLMVAAVAQIALQGAITGDFIHKDVSLKGGISISIPAKEINPIEFQDYLSSKFKDTSIDVRLLKSYGNTEGVVVDSDISQDKWDDFESEIEKETGISRDKFSIEEMGGSLGSSFFRQTLIAIAVAFLFMSIVVFMYFKIPIPSLIVIVCAFADIIETVAVVNLLGIKVSTGGIAAFLMLIGYSVDTDILLTTRVLKRKEGTFYEKVYGAIGTGMTMTATTFVAVTIGIFFATSPVLKQIMTIILIGLVFDVLNTWIQNVVLIKWYVDKMEKKKDVQA